MGKKILKTGALIFAICLSFIFVQSVDSALETQLLVDVSPSTDSAPYQQTQWYSFSAIGGNGYCAILMPSSGNPDTYLFDTNFNRVGYSKNSGTTADKVWYGQASSGPMHIGCYGVYNPSSNFTIQVITAPYIKSMSPTSGAAETLVTLTGYGFGATQADSYVKFGTVNATNYSSWSNTQIKVYVPSGVPGGVIQVVVYVASKASNPMNFTASGASSNGTMWRYDLGRSGNYPNGPAVFPLTIKWKYVHSAPWIHPFPNQVPVLAGNWLYLPEDHSLHVLDINTGTLKYTYGGPYSQITPTTPVVANGIVYVDVGSTRDNVGTFYAFTTGADGKLTQKWMKEFVSPVSSGYAISSAIVYNDTVYFSASDGTFDRYSRVYALDANTGNTKWFYSLPLKEVNSYFSPAIANGILYVRSDKKMYALNINTGALKWSFVRTETVDSLSFGGQPVVSNGVVYDCGDNKIYALDASTGSLKWSYALEIGQHYTDVIVSPAIDNKGILYFVSESDWGNYKVHALDTTTRALKWSYAFPLKNYVTAMPVVSNGVVYLGQVHTLFALDGTTGSLKWSYDFSGGAREPTIGNGRLYVAPWQDNGEVYCFGQ